MATTALDSSSVELGESESGDEHVSIDGGERVVEQVDVGTSVDGTSEGNPGLLTSRQTDSLLSDLSLQRKYRQT
jgi:hypothetical protein